MAYKFTAAMRGGWSEGLSIQIKFGNGTAEAVRT